MLDEQIKAIGAGETISPEFTDRQIATGARRSRHRKRILAIYGPTSQGETLDPARGLEARATIRSLARRAGAFDILLLVAVASGISQATIAERLFMSPAAIRQKISRARRANDHLRD